MAQPGATGGVSAAADRGLDTAERALRLARARAADAEVEVTVRTGLESLTRFATGFIHQNVASEINHVLIRVAVDGRNASTSVDGPADDESLGRAIDGVLEAARVRPPDPDWPGLAVRADAPAVDHWDEATAAATPDERASRVREFVDAADGLETAGFCSTTVVRLAFANSAGQRLTGRGTAASQTAPASLSARAASSNLSHASDSGVARRTAATRSSSSTFRARRMRGWGQSISPSRCGRASDSTSSRPRAVR